ncbi:MAG: alpha/beta hydrolase [Candidatus Pacearchaeota archaeon]|nr:alpha/beta hydrolase [Candidatus Pacearchaeota archaeon]
MNIILIHGSNKNDRENTIKYNLPPQNKRDWIPWLKQEIEKINIKIETPLMPENWSPNYNKWKNQLEKLQINKNTILIGHSAGADFLTRWLGETKTKIKKLILIAPGILWKNYSQEYSNLCNFKINPEIKKNINQIIIFVSNNDHKKILESVNEYSKKLEIKPIILKNRGHFVKKKQNQKEINSKFPELLNKILE